MQKLCDNKSVGVLVWDGDKLLLIERKKYNFGFAVPAGHCDGLSFEEAARSELSEEVGLDAGNLTRKTNRIALSNPCRRKDGACHEWVIFEATGWRGSINASREETKSYLWADRKKLQGLALRLAEFAQRKKIPLLPRYLPQLVRSANSDLVWQKSPGLEPPMYFLLQHLHIIE